ncbi:MAG: hypothetical protein IPP98_16385 [Gemmatimonadetes bacterium]|nr:hypothetical protein [Gemmatimonadota bacterium]
MCKGHTPIVVAILLLGGAFTAAAQQSPLPASVDSGKMVRMYTATTMIRGRLLASVPARTTPAFTTAVSPEAVPRNQTRPPCSPIRSGELRRLDVSTGSH